MRNRSFGIVLRGCSALALVWVAIPAVAQTAGPDIVMRRPLPNRAGVSSTQTSCDSNGVCTPTPTPSDGGNGDPGSVPPGGGPGFSYDPSIQTSFDPGNSPQGIAQWVAGPWTGGAVGGGAGQCGGESHYVREISCVSLESSGGPIGIGTNVSYSSGSSDGLVNAIFDPAVSPVRMTNAQFTGNPANLSSSPAPLSFCQQNAGDPPPNTYNGKEAECDYHGSDDGTGQWQLDPGENGTATCSAAAYRRPSYSCTGPDGRPADLQFCFENVRNGATRNDFMVNPTYGNFEGCRTGWVGESGFASCRNPETNVEGRTSFTNYAYSCVRTDGEIQSDAACTDPRPDDGVKPAGSCEKTWNFNGNTSGCFAGDSREYVIGIQDITPQQAQNNVKGNDFCANNGATCCQYRMVFNTNYAGALLNTWQVVATNGPRVIDNAHFDENDFRARPGSIEEGPYFLDIGGTASFVPNTYYPPNDDPDNILNGRGVNHPIVLGPEG